MARYETIDTKSAVATADPVATGPRDPREAAFVRALTASTDTKLERYVVKAGQLFLLASAGFVVAAALIASMV